MYMPGVFVLFYLDKSKISRNAVQRYRHAIGIFNIGQLKQCYMSI